MSDTKNGVSIEDQANREKLQRYSDGLQLANNKTQEELDKSLITLSTVLIGVVLTLRQQIAGTHSNLGFPNTMWVAIGCLLACVLSVLFSHFLSLWVNQLLIDAVEEGRDLNEAYSRTTIVRWVNRASAALFFLGLLFAIFFAVQGASGTLTT